MPLLSLYFDALLAPHVELAYQWVNHSAGPLSVLH
jgi:hypothetical protein